jgi:hypothetical protein
MKVKELIANLKQHDEDMEVVVRTDFPRSFHTDIEFSVLPLEFTPSSKRIVHVDFKRGKDMLIIK